MSEEPQERTIEPGEAWRTIIEAATMVTLPTTYKGELQHTIQAFSQHIQAMEDYIKKLEAKVAGTQLELESPDNAEPCGS